MKERERLEAEATARLRAVVAAARKVMDATPRAALNAERMRAHDALAAALRALDEVGHEA